MFFNIFLLYVLVCLYLHKFFVMKKLFYFLSALIFVANSIFSQQINKECWVTDGPVFSIVSDENNVYIGGKFNKVAPVTGPAASIDINTGFADTDMPYIEGIDVYTIVSDNQGGWYIGGYFDFVDGYPIKNVAHIKADKTVDTLWKPNPNKPVNCIEVFNNNVFIGGIFDTIDNYPIKVFAKVDNIQGNVDTTWNFNIDYSYSSIGIYPSINSIAINGSYLYIAGKFDIIGGLPANTIKHLALIDINTGALNTDFHPNPSYMIKKTYLYNDKLYCIGQGNPLFYIQGNSSTLFIVNNFSGSLSDIKIWGSYIYVAGMIEYNSTTYYMARFNLSTGLLDESWNPGFNNYVNTFSIYGNYIFAGGIFNSIDGQIVPNIAKINLSDGSVISTWKPDPIIKYDVWNDIYIYCTNIIGNKLYVGGRFYAIGSVHKSNLAKLTTNGIIDASWTVNTNDTVYILTLYGDNLYAGGKFTTIGGTNRNYIARLNKNTGVVDANWNPNANNVVKTIAIVSSFTSTDIYVGGAFTSIGGQTRNRIAKLTNSTGTANITWNPNANGEVRVIKPSLFSLVVGGTFTNIGGQPQSYAAILDNTNGNANTSWTPVLNGYVNDITISGNEYILAGNFTNVNGYNRRNLVKIDNSGVLISSWNPNPDNEIKSIKLIGNSLYVAGNFGFIGTTPVFGLAKIDLYSGNLTNDFSNVIHSIYNSFDKTYCLNIVKNKIFIANIIHILNYNNINEYGGSYFAKKLFCLSYPIQLTTDSASTVTNHSTTLYGSIQSLGISDPTQHGFCWNTTGNPTIADNIINLGSANSMGQFSALFENLDECTTYYVRAYAINNADTAYGNVISFTSPDVTPPVPQMANLPDMGSLCPTTITSQYFAEDNCDGTITAVPNITQINQSTSVLWTYTDAAGNSFQQIQNYTIWDSVPPTFICPTDTIIELPQGQTTYTIQGSIFNPTDVYDDCGVASVVNNVNNSNTLDGQVLSVGNHAVTWMITDNIGYSDSCTFNITISSYNSLYANQYGSITIFPNPASGIIYYDLSNISAEKIVIYDNLGKAVLEKNNPCSKGEISLADLNNGVYFVKIYTHDEIMVTKLLKE